MVPGALRAQGEDIDFTTARKAFIAGQPRNAANTLLESSLGVRQQVGRCRDETVGAELLEAESNLEKLANGLRNGTVKELKALDQALKGIDHSLAHHHLLLVQTALAHPRGDNINVASHDLDRAAFHFERSVTLDGGKLTPEQTAALADARKLSSDLATATSVPSGANAVISALEKVILANGSVATVK